jgi:flagellar motility protein MotE (MotC chaperone)
MADNILNAPEDPKVAKAQLKADKKEYKKNLKEQRKAQKEKEKEFADRTAEINGDNAGGLATIVITFLIILIWLAIMALLVKLDVGGFGSGILAPLIRDIPYVNMILPESARNKTATPSSTTTTELVFDESGEGQSSGAITNMDDAQAYIKRLEQALQAEMETNSSYAADIERLEAEVARLEPFEKQQKEFYEEKAKFYEDIVYGDNSPDASAFASYYEMIDPENAEEIYKQIIQGNADDEAIKAFATTYSGMKAKKAAEIFDEMVVENQITLVARILAQMSVENRGDILAAMEKENSAKLTQLLEPTALEQKSTKVTGR